MNKKEFDEMVLKAERKNPIWFELERDPPADISEIDEVESILNVRFPGEYKDFLLSYGAGYFAFMLVLGVKTETQWNVIRHASLLPSNFLPAADNASGDYYGFVVRGGECDRSVAFWDHETGSIQENVFPNFYEMLSTKALMP
ncbi:hypothetical protein DC522_07485 [Microvirga sp. KLBC 81]|uniref:SMI1/KNR4 family protein n=1 Tax=Microvirga sp. KLBC 81 TaxID=1862707 RepID=UPI000D512E2A|nr:SMI1/KNR4 family protein [Microvirga sp. KLBC 81]PVE25050.1 hypothetical protein DC522_07485 [Microvirga sp. KLBC 81]